MFFPKVIFEENIKLEYGEGLAAAMILEYEQ
jgi:hypothetical protein